MGMELDKRMKVWSTPGVGPWGSVLALPSGVSLTSLQCCCFLPEHDPAVLLCASAPSAYTCEPGEPAVPSVCQNRAPAWLLLPAPGSKHRHTQLF